MKRTRSHVSVTVYAAVLLTSASSWADDPVAACIDANERSLTLRKQSSLIESQDESAKCAAASCPEEIRAACGQRIADISALIPSVILLVKDSKGVDVADLNLTIDDRPMGKLLLSALKLNPGSHKIGLTTADGAHAERTLVLREGEVGRRERLVLTPPEQSQTMPEHPVAVSQQPAVAAPSTPEPDSSTANQQSPTPGRGQRVAGIAIGVIGLASVAVGSVLGGLAISKWNSAKTDCGAGCSATDPAQDERSTASTFGTISTIALIAGGVALGTGIILFVTAPKKQNTETAWLGVRPGVGGLVLVGGF